MQSRGEESDRERFAEVLKHVGVDRVSAMNKVSEVYSPTRVTEVAKKRLELGVEGLRPFDLSSCTADGSRWDFSKPKPRRAAWDMRDRRPGLADRKPSMYSS